MEIFAIFLFTALTWGLFNRLRGWGGGWNNTNEPKWLLWVQKNIFSRPIMASACGFTLSHFALTVGVPYWWTLYISLVVALFWWFAVVFGWGEYQDGQKADNREIEWIDSVVWFIRPYLSPRFVNDANLIDAISMGLRGVYYLPMSLLFAPVVGWWVLLPALTFWQAGPIYFYARRIAPLSDFVLYCEWADNAIRCLILGAAIWLSVS